MEINKIISEIKVWDGWAVKYKEFVPQFIEEAINKNSWQEWDKKVFTEFFEKNRDQCVSSLQQGYYTIIEKSVIKENWTELAPLLKKIASQQDKLDLDTYAEIKKWLRKHTSQNRKASVNRLIASLQPELLCSIVNESSLRVLMQKINQLEPETNLKITGNWFINSNTTLNYFKSKMPNENIYDIMTYPWQTYEILTKKKTITNTNEMSDVNELDTIKELLHYKKQIILQGPPGTGKTKMAEELAKELISLNKIENQTVQLKVLTRDYIKSNLKENQKIDSKNNKEFEVVALEQNVVLLKSDVSKPWKPSYNKIIDSFNNKLWETKGRTGGYKSYEDAIAKYFYDNHLESIPSLEQNVGNEKDFLKLIQFHPSYTYEDFVRGIVAKPNEDGGGIIYEAENKTLAKFAEMAFDEPDNNYVLIIDEINRANLSSVLGELIYGLEYRGKAVDSIYTVGDSNELILPANLYIIGTMNTADRSVGHIDYAIRRRFAFVDVLPNDLSEDDKIVFDSKLFEQVAKIFVKNYDTSVDYNIIETIENSEHLNSDFEAKDVWLGHSYFIKQYEKDEKGEDIVDQPFNFKMRLDYEIKPILLEYVKDGILKESAKKEIAALKISI